MQQSFVDINTYFFHAYDALISMASIVPMYPWDFAVLLCRADKFTAKSAIGLPLRLALIP